MSPVRFALKQPYTVVAVLVLICLLGIGAAWRMPVDIFPEIDIPVVSVVWTYNGMSAEEMQDRILVNHERQMASLVDDIDRLEANSYDGVGVIKVYLHEGANVSKAITQLSSCAETVLKNLPPNITPPLIVRYGATDVPILQLSLTSNNLPDQRLTDFGQQVLRPNLAVVHGAQVPYPYGGKPRVIMVDLDQEALQSRGLTPADVVSALGEQNLQAPSGDVKIGDRDYVVPLNNSTQTVDALNDFPVKTIAGKTVFLRDVAHVRDGYAIQTNSVSVNGQLGALMTIRKTGGVSTLAVIDGVRAALPDIEHSLPAGMSIHPLFDQSILVKASLFSVLMGGTMAAVLTALMILLFLGNARLTVIILASIPLSIVTALLVMYCAGQTLNTMTLGGFALAVGILVDNATVVIENIERHLGMRQTLDNLPQVLIEEAQQEPGTAKPPYRSSDTLEHCIIEGASEISVPTLLSTFAICIVFVPVFLLQGTAKYLFSPLSLSVCISLLASLVLSFTLVPVLFKYLMRSHIARHGHKEGMSDPARPPNRFNPAMWAHHVFDQGFNIFRNTYREVVAWAVASPWRTAGCFLALAGTSFLLFPRLGMDFFPDVDAGQMRLHVRAPPGTRLEKTQEYFVQVESAIRQIVGNNQIDEILDNIGLPYSGINISLSDTATAGPMDGEILISLKEKHTPTAGHLADLRRELPKRFPELLFFFQPADMINQVLNFGRPAPIDISVSGPHSADNYTTALKLLHDIRSVPGVVDAHIFQVPNAPALEMDVDRTLASRMNMSQRDVSNSMLVALDSSAMVSPNFWLSPANNVTYPLVVQTPQYRVKSMDDLLTIPVERNGSTEKQLVMNLAQVRLGAVPMMISQLNIRPVFDVQASVQGRDLAGVAGDLRKVIAADAPDPASAIHVELSGQVQTMGESFQGLFGGMALSVILVYLMMVINFQSWVDPVIVLMAVPFAFAGVVWMLFITQTHVSVPALMGTLMCIGLTTANSILVVTFANQRMAAGDDALSAAIAAGYTRLRPVLMTAGAMILGMIPMALGIGEGGEQNAPLARAVIGGLLFATFATLIFVPVMYRVLRSRRQTILAKEIRHAIA